LEKIRYSSFLPGFTVHIVFENFFHASGIFSTLRVSPRGRLESAGVFRKNTHWFSLQRSFCSFRAGVRPGAQICKYSKILLQFCKRMIYQIFFIQNKRRRFIGGKK